MSQFQLVGCRINLGGDRGSVVVKDRFNPVTYPEYLLLQVVHGGEEHVHHAMAVGWVERTPETELERLAGIYGDELTKLVFPGPARMLPLANEGMLTEEEYEAGENAKLAARARVRQGKSKRPTMELPSGVDELPAA